MKYIIIHGDGMADWPCDELGGKTPLEAAHKPNMDLHRDARDAWDGRDDSQGHAVGQRRRHHDDDRLRPGERYHTGRAPIEAASMGIAMGPRDVVFRMNLVSLNQTTAAR